MKGLTEEQEKLLREIVNAVDEKALTESFQTFHFGSKIELLNQEHPPNLEMDVGMISVLVEEGFLSYQHYGTVHQYTLKQAARDILNPMIKEETFKRKSINMNLIQFDLVEFKDLMNVHFSLGDLDDLCFDLGMEKENIDGTILKDRIRNLIELAKREGNLPELIVSVILRREKADWKRAFKES